MRRLFVFALVALLVGVGIVAIIETDPGYVLVSFGNYTLETSFWVGLLLLLLLVVAMFLLLRLVYRIAGGQRSLFSWFGARKTRNAQRLSTRGLISYTEGNWATARRQLLRGALGNDAPLVNYLLAARASAQLQDTDKLHEYLRAAGETGPGGNLAADITLAELKLQAGEHQQALVALDQAARSGDRHPYVLRLLSQAYQGLSDWDKLLDLLPQLKKLKVLGAAELQQLERQIHLSRLDQGDANLDQLHTSWHKVPKHLQRDAALVETYVANLIKLGDHDAAEHTVLRTLKNEWSVPLVRQYGYVQCADATRQLAKAESWLGQHPQEPQLLLCLGRLASRAKLWGKARDYFESSYRLQHSAEVCAELGRLLTALGEPGVAAAYFQEGLLLRENNLPALPVPDKTVSEGRLLARF